ncbi:glycoside hydrolase family 130 protein [Chitinophaga deserti]|uniref:glycoside hydrolase family 130 protein n=1 Tax=Chitinophaga deserti TaxID=2164099 RepID=UPI000D6B8352|nr:glycoside hydrolase family 130 protein [Chitinophaga deserti]
MKIPRILSALLLLLILHPAIAQHRLPAWAMGGFVRPEGRNPVISPDSLIRFWCPMHEDSVAWQSNDTFNPAAAVKDGRIVLLYRAEDKSGVKIGHRTSRIGHAVSTDGITFDRMPVPVMYPAVDSQQANEWPGGCEDPRVAVTEDGLYVMLYTQWNRTIARLGVATSRDLIHWEKHGPAFEQAYDGKFNKSWSKSASLVTEIKDGKQVIAKLNGRYFMYWGERGVHGAWSDNLTDWEPVTDSTGELKAFIRPRNGYFDSDLTECGPPAIKTPSGILLLYNGKNKSNTGRDPRFNANAYCAGQVLFDSADPTKVIARLDVPFLRPMAPFEKSGQYRDGTVFIEGMAYYGGKWYLYYGCADSRVGVAIYDPASPAAADPLPDAP